MEETADVAAMLELSEIVESEVVADGAWGMAPAKAKAIAVVKKTGVVSILAVCWWLWIGNEGREC